MTNNLAYDRYTRGEYQEALAGFKKAVEMSPSPRPFHVTNVGKAFEGLGDLDSALVWGRRGLEVAHDGGRPWDIRYTAEFLKDVLVSTGRDKEAYRVLELYVQMDDSLNNEEVRQAALKQQLEAEHEKDLALAEERGPVTPKLS